MMFKRSKYGAKKTIANWIKFDSKIEADYYLYLLDLKNSWEVKAIYLQPRFQLLEKFIHNWKKYQSICYVWDFKVEYSDWTTQIVDTKGMPTNEAKLKKKMFHYYHPDLDLVWLVKHKWQRVGFEENQKRIRNNKKLKRVNQ